MNAEEYLAKSIDKVVEAKVKKAMRGGPSTLQAVVTGTDSQGKTWVRLPGAENDTPVKRSAAETEVGDIVSVTISNGRAIIDSNISNPAAGAKRVDTVQQQTAENRRTAENLTLNVQGIAADVAVTQGAAMEALTQAQNASEAADTAWAYADDALVQAQTVQANLGLFERVVTGDLEAQHAHIGELEADTAKIHSLTADELSAATGYIADLKSDNIEADTIAANVGKIKDITGESLSYATGYIADLRSENITAQNIISDHGVIDTLDSNYAHIENGVIDNAKIGYADVNDLNAHYAEIKQGHINSALIDTAAIVDEQVFTVTGNKATLSEINADKITVRNLNAKNLTIDTADGYVTIGDKKTPTKEFIDSLKDELQQEIDGAVETWTSTAVPLLNNYPANQWADDKTKAKHVGDICYVQQSGSDYDGFCYRFAYSNGEFLWVLIKDSSVTKALADISDLQTFESETVSWIDETEDGLTTIRQNHTNLSGVVDKTVKSSTQLWYTKANTTAPTKPTSKVTSTATTGDAWRTVVPAWSASYPNYFYCWQFELADGTYAWGDVVRDIAMGESQGTSRSAQTTANANIKSSVQLWFTKANATAPAKPTAQVTTNNPATGNAWNLAVPTYSASYPHYFYCYQQQKGDGTYQWSDVVYDKGTTEAMQKAQAALPSSTFETFEQTTFKTVVDEVGEQSSTIAQMSETVKHGGKNLLPHTGVTAADKEWLKDNISSAWNNLAIETVDGESAYKYDPTWGPSYWQSGAWCTLKADTYYTYSVDLHYTKDVPFNMNSLGHFQVYNAASEKSDKSHEDVSDKRVFTPATIPANTWTRASVTFLTNELDGSTFRIYPRFNIAANDGTLHFKNAKLENGTIATPWDYASEDVTTLTNTVNTVKQTADTNSASISSLTTTVANNKTAIENRASKIEQTLDGFSSTVSATIAESVQGDNVLTGNALNPNNWTINAPTAANFTKAAYGTAGTKVTFDAVSGYENLYSPDIPVTNGSTYTLSVEYTVGKDYNTTANRSGYGLGVYKGTGYPSSTYDESNSKFIAKAAFFRTQTRVAQTATVTFTATSDKLVLMLNGGHIADGQTGLSFTIDKLKLVESISSRVSSAETAIEQTADAIGLSASGTTTIANPNLSPFFEFTPFGTSGSSYWTNNFTTGAFTALEDGWAHFHRHNTGTAVQNNYVRMVACPSVVQGEVYTCLVEIRNITTNTATSYDFYTQQSTDTQFWGSGGTHGYIDGYDGFSLNNNGLAAGAHYFPMKARGITEHSTTGTRLIDFNWQVPAGAEIECDVRVSLYKGDYRGPWKPYSGSQLYASQAELKVANDNISSKVSTTDYTGATVASLINQSATTVKIQAQHVEIDGTTTFLSGDTVTDLGSYLGSNYVGEKEITTATDFNTLTSSGVYYIKNGSCANAPVTNWGKLDVSVSGKVVQLFYPDALSYYYYRAKTSGTWSAWTKVDGVGAAADVQANLDKLGVSGRNLLVGTYSPRTSSAITLNSSNYQVWDPYELYTPYNKIVESGDLITVSFDWSCTATGGNWHLECSTGSPYTWGTVVSAKGTRSATSNYVDVSSSNKSGHVEVTFQAAAAHVSADDTLRWLRIRVDGTQWSGQTFHISNAKAERGNRASEWTYAPEDTVEIGRNLAMHPDIPVQWTSYTPTAYQIARIPLSEDFKTGYTYTVTVWGGPITRSDKSECWYSCYWAGGNFKLGDAKLVSTGVYRCTFTVSTTSTEQHTAIPQSLVLYNTTSADASGTTYSAPITRVKVERSAQASDFSYTPESVVVRTQRVYHRKAASGAPAAPTSWVTAGNDGSNKYAQWTTKLPPIAASQAADATKYLYLYTCIQSQNAAGQITNSAVLLDDSTTVIDGGNIITGSVTANQLNASNINASKLLTVGSMTTDAQSSILNSNVTDTFNGYTILWNYSAFGTANNGEGYICKRDPLTGTKSDANGTVMWNGVQRTVPKGMVNPNAVHPVNVPIYIVCRLSSDTATTGTNYIVSYDSGWKGGTIGAGALADWTWAEATDMVLGKFVMTAAEGAMSEMELYDPPWSCKQVSTDTVTARSANATANTANDKANAWRGTLSGSMAEAAKTVACTGFTSDHLVTGTAITVYSNNSQSNASPTINVNSTGAKKVFVNNAVTSDTNRLLWLYGCTLTFVYNSSLDSGNGGWIYSDNPPTYYGSACAVAEGTAAKTTVVDSAILCKGAMVTVPMNNTTTVAPTLAILNASGTSLGASNIYHGTSTNGPTKDNGLAWPAGAAVIFTYDGKYWRTGNQTFIDGGNVVTGKVGADHIDVASISIGNLNGASTVISNASDGASALTKVNYYNRSCQVGQSTGTVSNPWYKFASCSITGTNIDYTIQFAVQAAGNYSDTKRDGTLRAHVRTGSTAGTFSSAQLEWLNRATGITLANFVLAYKATSGSKVDVELWCKVDTGWHGFQFFVEHEATRTGIASSALWTLYDNWGQDKSAASITSGYTQITSTDTDAARQTATNYIHADSSGIRIASANPGTATTYQHQTATSTEFVVGGTSMAEFSGSGARLGEEDGMRTEVKAGEIAMHDPSGALVMYIYSRNTNSDGTATASMTTTGNGSTKTFTPMYKPSAVVSAAYTDGSTLAAPSISGSSFSFSTAPAAKQFTVTYKTAEPVFHATLGTRLAGQAYGNSSMALGRLNTATTQGATAIGRSNKATATDAYAIGYDNEATAANAYALGRGLLAASAGQMVVGKYNKSDDNGTYAFIVGNGTGTSARKNAFAIDPGGRVIAYTTNDTSSNHGFVIEDEDSGSSRDMLFGLGGSYVNRGIFDYKLDRWLIYADDSDVYVNGYPSSANSTKMADTGWVNVGSGYVKYRIKNDICFVRGNSGSGGVSIATGGTNIGTLPAEARPNLEMFAPITTKSKNVGEIAIATTGVMTAFSFEGATTYWGFLISYPV